MQIKDAFRVDLLEQTIRARSSALARWSSDRDIKGPLLCGCREFNYLACAVILRRIRGSVPGSVKRYAAQRSWLTSAGSQRVEIRKLQGRSL